MRPRNPSRTDDTGVGPMHLFIVAFDGQHKATRTQMLRRDGA